MLRVLIVEDDPMISEIYKKKFSREGHEVLTAVSGEQVLNLAKREKIDIILLDLIMPKMDGFEVIKNLRSGSYDPKIKIIVFSNMSQSEDREKALELGADGFILKSQYNPSELVAEVVRLSNQYVEQEKNEKRENGEGEKKENPNQKKRILMIEDEDIFIEMFGKKLEQEGLDVTFAKNGAWGIKEALRDEFDLFLIDMVMPAMTGEEMVSRIKLKEKTKKKPIIMLSASVEKEAEKKVRDLGVNDFFVKTQITPTELAKKVLTLLSK